MGGSRVPVCVTEILRLRASPAIDIITHAHPAPAHINATRYKARPFITRHSMPSSSATCGRAQPANCKTGVARSPSRPCASTWSATAAAAAAAASPPLLPTPLKLEPDEPLELVGLQPPKVLHVANDKHGPLLPSSPVCCAWYLEKIHELIHKSGT